MNTQVELLLLVLRNALWGGSIYEDIPEDEVNRILIFAKMHAISGLIIDALIKNDVRMERQTLLESIGFLEQIKQENMSLNHEVSTFARMMAEAGSDYIIVKGQALAALYSHPLVRMPGDIDFLATDYYGIARVLKDNWGVELPDHIFEKEISFTHNTAHYDLHSYLIDFGSNGHKRYWEKVLQEKSNCNIIISGEKVKILEPTLNTVYVFLHLFFHFVKEGVGLRHLCDWAMMMHYYANNIDKAQLVNILQHVGMLKAFHVFGTILVDKLGMTDFPLVLARKDRKMQSCIMKDIMHNGNFGVGKRSVKQKGFRYKIETMSFVLSNSIKYFSLAPKEMILIPYRRVVVNLNLIWTKR